MDALTRLALEARTDGSAREALVTSSYDEVWRLCAAIVDRDVADDLAQETFARAMAGLAGFRASASARTWLLAVARHACFDELRRRQRQQRRMARYAASAAGEPAGMPGADASEEPTVSDLLGRLGPDRRAAFALTQLLGCSYEEAAQVCGCPPGTIRSWVARARADLVGQLGPPATAGTGPGSSGARDR